LHKNIAKQFLDALTARCEKMVVGDGMSENVDMGPVAGPQQFEDISKAIKLAQSEGARMIAGSAPGDPKGYFIRPTVFTGVKTSMAVFREEIFGPVLAVCEFGSLDEGLELANNSIYGLSSAIFTKNLGNAKNYIENIEAGLAHVNVHTGYKEPSMPFGGVKQSGAGLPENARASNSSSIKKRYISAVKKWELATNGTKGIH
jgi:aldehyde dehydrogenase (NAD+)